MLQSLILLSFTKINLPWSNLIPFSSCCSWGKAHLLHVWIITVLPASVHFLWPISLKIKGFLFVAGHNLDSSDVEQVGTVESRQSVCVRDGDNLLGNIVSLFLRNCSGSSVFAYFLREWISQASGSTFRVSVVVVHREAEAWEAHKHTRTLNLLVNSQKACYRQKSKERALTITVSDLFFTQPTTSCIMYLQTRHLASCGFFTKLDFAASHARTTTLNPILWMFVSLLNVIYLLFYWADFLCTCCIHANIRISAICWCINTSAHLMTELKI